MKILLATLLLIFLTGCPTTQEFLEQTVENCQVRLYPVTVADREKFLESIKNDGYVTVQFPNWKVADDYQGETELPLEFYIVAPKDVVNWQECEIRNYAKFNRKD